MKQRYILYFFILSSIVATLSFISCKDKEPLEPFACERELGVFENGVVADNYIKGTIGGEQFYYGDKSSRFIKNTAMINESSGQSLSQTSFAFGLVDTLYFRYAYLPKINRPLFNFQFHYYSNKDLDIISYCDTVFQPGAVKVSGNTSLGAESNTIGIIMDVSCDNALFTRWKSASGDQSNSYFTIKTVNRKENDYEVTWTIVAEFEMNIYKDVFGEKIWNRIENGETKMDITVKK